MIPSTFIEFYGDRTRWFVGVVVDLDDPLKLGRVKVKVSGIYDEIKDEDLPWAQIVVPVTEGVHEGKGQYLGILKGTNVFGMFLDGNSSQLPLVIGTIPKDGDANDKADENYPFNKVYETERGHYKEYDDTEGSERIREQHKTGTHYEMKANGDLHIEADKDIYIKAPNANVYIEAALSVDVQASVNVNVTAPTISLNGGVVKLNS